MTAKSKKPLLLAGSFYVRDKFVSRAFIQTALEATGHKVLPRLPKDAKRVVLLSGRVLGKRTKTALHKTVEPLGLDVLDLDALVTPRFNTALAKCMKSSSKLLASEKKLLEELTPTKKSA